MKRVLFTLCIIVATSISSLSYAQSIKTISLKDGSQIKGTILSVSNNVYTIQSSFGTLEINDSNISSISSENATSSAQPKMISDRQLAEYQKQLLQNPNVMSGIEDIASDPEVMQALSDPAFAQAIMSQDMQKLQNSDQFKQLIQNPKMQQLINNAGQAIGR